VCNSVEINKINRRRQVPVKRAAAAAEKFRNKIQSYLWLLQDASSAVDVIIGLFLYVAKSF